MNKKVGIIVAIVVVAGLALAGTFLLLKPTGKPLITYKIDAKKEAAESLARYVPQNVVAYYSISNIETMWNNIRNSNFWKEFTALKIWQDAEMNTALENFKKDFTTQYGFELGEGTMMDLMGQELALAVLPMKLEQPQPSVILLSRVGAKTKVADTIVKMMEKTRGEAKSEIETTKRGSSEIVEIKGGEEGDPELYYAIVGNNLVLGVGPDSRASVENAIDIADGKSQDSLANNPQYRDLIASTTLGKNTVGRFYMDMSNIGSFMTALAAIPGGAALPANVADAFGVLKMIGGTMVMNQGLYTKIQIIPNREKMDAQTRAMWDSRPAKPESIAFIPAGSYLYSASSSLDVKSMWDLWQTNLKAQNAQQAQLITTGIQNFEQAIGVSIEKDIISWIGNEAAYLFYEIGKGLIPMPKMAILVKAKNKRDAEAFLNKLVDAVNKQTATLGAPAAAPEGEVAAPAAPPTPAAALAGFKLRIAKEPYKGEELNILDIPLLGKALAPSYAFVGDFLIICSSSELLQQMIETYKGNLPSLEQDPEFQMAASVMDRKTNQLVYVNTSKMMDAGVEICNWIVSFQTLQTPPEAAGATPNQAFIQESLIPLLKCLKTIKVLGINTVYTSQGIEQTFFTQIEDKK